MYKLGKDANGNSSNTVLNIETGSWIPFDPANTDYQAYLKWVALGNQPTPAENN